MVAQIDREWDIVLVSRVDSDWISGRRPRLDFLEIYAEWRIAKGISANYIAFYTCFISTDPLEEQTGTYDTLGLNSTIQTIKQMAYGFRNKGHFKTAIYFHCGGLDLSPRSFRKNPSFFHVYAVWTIDFRWIYALDLVNLVVRDGIEAHIELRIHIQGERR